MSTNTLSRATTETDAAVRKVLDDLYEGWAANDADAVVADYIEEASSILPGSYRPTKAVIRQKFVEGFAGMLKDSTVRSEVLDVRQLSDDAAIVVTRDAVLFPGEAEVPAGREVLATWTFTKRDGRWMIAAYHNCPAELG